MNRDLVKNIDDFLDRFLPTASREDMDTDIREVFDRLKSASRTAASPRITSDFKHRAVPSLRWRMSLVALAGMFLSVLIVTRWQSVKPAEGISFELASIRPRQDSIQRENGRGGPLGGEKCNGTVRVNPARFSMSNASIYQLVTLAYSLDPDGITAGRCLNVTRWGLLSGGPNWVDTARFDIEAKIPDGMFDQTVVQDSRAPVQNAKLQGMLQTLLNVRFNLKLRREMKEMPAYVLRVAQGGPKLTPWQEGDPISAGAFGLGGDGVAFIRATKMSMPQLASRLATAMNRPVIDQTGVEGDYKFTIGFAPTTDYFTLMGVNLQPAAAGIPSPTYSESLFAVLQKQLGLELAASRERVEVFVIERVDRPSEN